MTTVKTLEHCPVVDDPVTALAAMLHGLDVNRAVGDRDVRIPANIFTGGSPYVVYASLRGCQSGDTDFDCIEILEAIEDELYNLAEEKSTACMLVIDGSFYISRPFVVRDRVNLYGINAIETSVNALPSFIGGYVIKLQPVTGRSVNRLLQYVHNMRIDGNRIGLYQATGTTTKGSATIPDFASSSFTGSNKVPQGYLIKGPGIPFPCYVQSHIGTAVTLATGLVATYDNFNLANPTLDMKRLLILEGVTTTCNGTAGTKVINVASKVGMKVGMRLLADNLEVDSNEGGVSQFTRIDSIDPTLNQITVNRPIALTGGSYLLLAWVEVDNLYIENPDQPRQLLLEQFQWLRHHASQPSE